MGKMTTYLLIMSGITLLFYFGGLLVGTGSSAILNTLLKIGTIGDGSVFFYTKIYVAIITMGAVVVGLGIISRSPEWIALAPVALFLLSFGWDFYAIFIIGYAINPAMGLLMTPLFLIWILGVFEWFRGITT